jgi:hypothetical protein
MRHSQWFHIQLYQQLEKQVPSLANLLEGRKLDDIADEASTFFFPCLLLIDLSSWIAVATRLVVKTSSVSKTMRNGFAPMTHHSTRCSGPTTRLREASSILKLPALYARSVGLRSLMVTQSKPNCLLSLIMPMSLQVPPEIGRWKTHPPST